MVTAFDIFPLVAGWLNQLTVFFIAGAIAMFFWGVIKFINSAGNETERTKGKQFIIWGIVGFVVIVSLWGLVWFIQQSFGIGPTLPEYRNSSGGIIAP